MERVALMKVIELIPGMKILDPTQYDIAHTFVAQCPHPLYTKLQLVIWRMQNGTWSHDALSPIQDVGECMPFTPTELKENLRAAFHG